MGKRQRKWVRETEGTSEIGERIDKALQAEFGDMDDDWPTLFVMIKQGEGNSTVTYVPDSRRSPNTSPDMEAAWLAFQAFNTFYECSSPKDKRKLDALLGERPKRRVRDLFKVLKPTGDSESTPLTELDHLKQEHAKLNERYDTRRTAYQNHLAIYQQNPTQARYASLQKDKRDIKLLSRRLTQMEERMKELRLHA